ncbi:hypothetical protein VaNZ11_001331 [Volvox africanus]|uniref:Uncharacterized protein n=1 Tax=Volvox africanus TaxID=51714 RepID=A0ABQ5RR12_9CHLO|nr:hypothetical protein VaNZ11_001331 [Volvox africanus]
MDAMETEKLNPKKKPTFKLIGQLVLAMKRFQAALNPTYNYGANKRPQSSSLANGLPRGRTMSVPAGGRTASGAAASKTLSGRPDVSGKQHGFKGNLLFKPLPPLSSEQETSA